MPTEGRVLIGATLIGTFVIRFDGGIVFSLRNGESIAEALERASQHGMTVNLRLSPQPSGDK